MGPVKLATGEDPAACVAACRKPGAPIAAGPRVTHVGSRVFGDIRSEGASNAVESHNIVVGEFCEQGHPPSSPA
jgi:hypothetical protein